MSACSMNCKECKLQNICGDDSYLGSSETSIEIPSTYEEVFAIGYVNDTKLHQIPLVPRIKYPYKTQT